MKESTKTLYPVTMIGTGPGDPELLTIKAKNIMSEADYVLYDCLPATHVLNAAGKKAIVKFINRHIENGPVTEDILEVARYLYLQGKKVVRIKAGEAMMFNGGGSDCKRLKEMGVRFNVIPGLTAASAATSLFAIPITEKSESNSIVYAIADKIDDRIDHLRDISHLFKHGTTLALYMAYDNLKDIIKIFKSEGIEGTLPVVIASMISLKNQDCAMATLDTVFEVIENREMLAPFVFFIGKYVNVNIVATDMN